MSRANVLIENHVVNLVGVKMFHRGAEDNMF